MNIVNHFINGKEYVSKSDRFGDVYNPENGEKISIFSEQGKNVLKKYTKASKIQKGSG